MLLERVLLGQVREQLEQQLDLAKKRQEEAEVHLAAANEKVIQLGDKVEQAQQQVTNAQEESRALQQELETLKGDGERLRAALIVEDTKFKDRESLFQKQREELELNWQLKLEELQQEHDKAFAKQREHSTAEIDAVWQTKLEEYKTVHVQQLESLALDHRKQLELLKEEHNQLLQQAHDNQENVTRKLKEEEEERFQKMSEVHRQQLEVVAENHQQLLCQVKEEQAQRVNQLEESHVKALKAAESSASQTSSTVAALEEQLKQTTELLETRCSKLEIEKQEQEKAFRAAMEDLSVKLNSEHESKMGEWNKKHEEKLMQVQAEHEESLTRIKTEHDEKLAQAKKAYGKKLKQLQEEHESRAQQAVAQHEVKEQELIGQHKAEIQQMEAEHATALKSLHESHNNDLEQCKASSQALLEERISQLKQAHAETMESQGSALSALWQGKLEAAVQEQLNNAQEARDELQSKIKSLQARCEEAEAIALKTSEDSTVRLQELQRQNEQLHVTSSSLEKDADGLRETLAALTVQLEQQRLENMAMASQHSETLAILKAEHESALKETETAWVLKLEQQVEQHAARVAEMEGQALEKISVVKSELEAVLSSGKAERESVANEEKQRAAEAESKLKNIAKTWKTRALKAEEEKENALRDSKEVSERLREVEKRNSEMQSVINEKDEALAELQREEEALNAKRLEESTSQSASHKEEMERLHSTHIDEIEKLKKEHSVALHELRQTLESETTSNLLKQHEAALENLKAAHTQALIEEQETRSVAMQELQQEHSLALQQLRDDHRMGQAALREAHASELREIEEKHHMAFTEFKNEQSETQQRWLEQKQAEILQSSNDQKTQYEQEFEKLHREHSASVAALKAGHALQLDDLSKDYELKLADVSSKGEATSTILLTEMQTKLNGTTKELMHTHEELAHLKESIVAMTQQYKDKLISVQRDQIESIERAREEGKNLALSQMDDVQTSVEVLQQAVDQASEEKRKLYEHCSELEQQLATAVRNMEQSLSDCDEKWAAQLDAAVVAEQAKAREVLAAMEKQKAKEVGKDAPESAGEQEMEETPQKTHISALKNELQQATQRLEQQLVAQQREMAQLRQQLEDKMYELDAAYMAKAEALQAAANLQRECEHWKLLAEHVQEGLAGPGEEGTANRIVQHSNRSFAQCDGDIGRDKEMCGAKEDPSSASHQMESWPMSNESERVFQGDLGSSPRMAARTVRLSAMHSGGNQQIGANKRSGVSVAQVLAERDASAIDAPRLNADDSWVSWGEIHVRRRFKYIYLLPINSAIHKSIRTSMECGAYLQTKL